jgi:hypothetical protein
MIIAGDFDMHIPKGLCIKDVSLGDINGDGIIDVLISLKTAGYHAAAYGAEVPLFLLLGQQGGGFIVEQKIPDVLYGYYRNLSHSEAGNGYIDIVYDLVDGAACHHTDTSRFWYDEIENDWLLKEFYYQQAFSADPHAFVCALPEMMDLPLSEFAESRLTQGYIITNLEFFDTVCELPVESSNDGIHLSYTIAAKVDSTNMYYEGYILMQFESDGWVSFFIQTIRGEYEAGTPLAITANNEDLSFTIQGDTWRRSEHDIDDFELVEIEGTCNG